MSRPLAARSSAVQLLSLLLAAGLTAIAAVPSSHAAPNEEPQLRIAPRGKTTTKSSKSKAASKRVAQRDETETPAEATVDDPPFTRRQKAPALDGGIAWINTAGPIDLKQLRGKFVILDFWTYCCINCMHILPELKKLEHAYPNEVVVIGVHSAKFNAEEDSKNIEDAVQRYEIEHPIVNDANHKIWQSYGVQSWPTLMVIDPEGNLVAGNSGEIDFESLDKFFKKVMPYYKRKGLLDESPLHFELAANQAVDTALRYPGKLLADEKSDRLFISDSNHNRIVIAKLDGTLLDVVGSGEVGAADGSYGKATFNHPQGMALEGHLNVLYVADTENHLIRKIDLKKKSVVTVAGTGRQGRGWPGMDDFVGGLGARSSKFRFTGVPLKTAINSPWALWIDGREMYIAMAGPHQIWRMALGKPEIGPYAGNGREDIVDGPLLPGQPYEMGFASFAQPSGLSSDGKVLYVADSEGSSIRAVPLDPSLNAVTVVGSAWLPTGRLFTFGDVDGQGQKVRLQHALDVLYHDNLLYVADTYNNKIKVVDPRQATSQTIAGTGKQGADDDPAAFDEPAGLAYANGKLYVADTNNHRIRTIDLKHGNKVATLAIAGLEPPALPKPKSKPNFDGAVKVDAAAVDLKPVDGKISLQVNLTLPEGYKMNALAPLRYLVESREASGCVSREAVDMLVTVPKPASSFKIVLPVTADSGMDKLAISLVYYYCQEGSEGVCKAGSVVWQVPIKLSADATESAAPLAYTVPN